jgi:deubiquitinase DESI2
MRTTGVYQMTPKDHQVFNFKYSIDLGEIDTKEFFKKNYPTKSHQYINFNRDVWPILDELMAKYKANTYNMLLRNCNHFSDEFTRRLYNKGIPSYINRAAWYGSFFHCLVPLKYLTVIPEGCTEE